MVRKPTINGKERSNKEAVSWSMLNGVVSRLRMNINVQRDIKIEKNNANNDQEYHDGKAYCGMKGKYTSKGKETMKGAQ